MKEINRRKSVFGGTFIYIEEGTGEGMGTADQHQGKEIEKKLRPQTIKM